MAYSELLADRIRHYLGEKKIDYVGKKMMGGLCFMVDDKMCMGVVQDNLMGRIGKEAYEDALTREGCRKMDFTGREMKGYVFVDPIGIDMDQDLAYWLDLCLAFNPLAKSSKKKKKK
ncbi:MAG: TfoX/Sxy family protein [Saprospiraceae bacterium]|nr:TfoX/Sxy family protein [Saprospiraceae bacterium]